MKMIAVTFLLLTSVNSFSSNHYDPINDPATAIEITYHKVIGDFEKYEFTSSSEISCYLFKDMGEGDEKFIFTNLVTRILKKARPDLTGKKSRLALKQVLGAVSQKIQLIVTDTTGHTFYARRCRTLGETNHFIKSLNP